MLLCCRVGCDLSASNLVVVRGKRTTDGRWRHDCGAFTLQEVAKDIRDVKMLLRPKSTRNPAIAEGPRDAGVPVEIW